MTHTNFYNEIDHTYEPGPWLKALIYLFLVAVAVAAPIIIASVLYGSETVVYWIADVIS